MSREGMTLSQGHIPDPKSWQSFMEPSSGRLPGLEATRPHMEPRATCSAAAPLVERQFRVLVGVTGSVAALKLPLLVSRLLDIPGSCGAVVVQPLHGFRGSSSEEWVDLVC
ncbi:phosphopantothenoylcysteine decarboxylase isoform 10-T10 [Megaptera novaeangliae]